LWGTAKAGGTISALESYLQRYPDGAHAAAAKALIERVRQEEASRALLQERELELRKAEEAKHQAEAKAEEARADDLALARRSAQSARSGAKGRG
jgi:hypothetical protein